MNEQQDAITKSSQHRSTNLPPNVILKRVNGKALRIYRIGPKLGLDLVPRLGAHMVEPDSMSVVELYHVHVSSAENTQGVSARGTIKKKEQKKL
ncbi:hypothetical protein NQ317_000863 [Molorchus minor]|uniref:Uncharacterized protein n=1 Tax=Molorchus minor TaxID=1323400 RepID=A0ABQ9JWG7_9CUCU|nr:hypothetical protein NQ317_000863 [Molorchus minor]